MSLELSAFVAAEAALIVGTVLPGGEPYATRGWGVTLPPEARGAASPSVRVVLDAAAVEVPGLASGASLALTSADVRTLRSLQLKGRTVGLEPPTADDLRTASAYFDSFATAVGETDGTSRHLLERLVPDAYVVAVVVVDEVFDQTPGPSAGAALAPPSP